MSIDIDHQLNLLSIHRTNLRHLLKQRAEYGTLVPIHVTSQIDNERYLVADGKATLKQHNVIVEDWPGIDYDERHTITITLPVEIYDQIRAIVAIYGIEIPERQ